MRISDWSSDVCSSDLDEEILVAVRHRPVERQRDLAHAGAYCPPGREIRSVLPDPCTRQPCAWRAARSAAETPTPLTRIAAVPPSLRPVVRAVAPPSLQPHVRPGCAPAGQAGVLIGDF